MPFAGIGPPAPLAGPPLLTARGGGPHTHPLPKIEVAMSFRSEWFDARCTHVGFLTQGDEPDWCDATVSGEVAVVFSGDSGAVIEGDKETVRRVLTAALDGLNKLP